MKRLIPVYLFLSIGFANAQNYGVKTKDLQALDKNILKSYKQETDKFSNASFLTPKVSTTSKYAYLSVKDGFLNFRLVMEYNGSQWLYLKNVVIKYGDKRIVYPAGDIKTYAGTDYVLETSDVKLDPETIAELKEAIKMDKVYVRLEGSNSVDDFEMSEKTKKSIGMALELYDKLKI